MVVKKDTKAPPIENKIFVHQVLLPKFPKFGFSFLSNTIIITEEAKNEEINTIKNFKVIILSY